MKCWCCNGKKIQENGYDDMFGNSKSWIEKCDYCNGIGWLDKEEEEKRQIESEKFAREFLKDEDWMN